MHDSIAYHVLKFAEYIFLKKSMCRVFCTSYCFSKKYCCYCFCICTIFCKDYLVKQCTNKPISADITVHV